MCQTMQQDRMESGITQHDLKQTLGRRILAKDCVNLFFYMVKHTSSINAARGWERRYTGSKGNGLTSV